MNYYKGTRSGAHSGRGLSQSPVSTVKTIRDLVFRNHLPCHCSYILSFPHPSTFPHLCFHKMLISTQFLGWVLEDSSLCIKGWIPQGADLSRGAFNQGGNSSVSAFLSLFETWNCPPQSEESLGTHCCLGL